MREAVNQGLASCTRKPRGNETEDEDRDCEMGSMGQAVKVLRVERDTNKVACEVRVGLKISLCATCCCPEPILMRVDSALAVTTPGAGCDA